MSLYEAREAALKDAADRFQRDTAQHEMTVLHDDGLYRHLRFDTPARKGPWFSLTTWPQKLVVNGEVGTYVLSRQEDMLDLIRQTSHSGPNFSYWEECVVASSGPIVDYRSGLLDALVAERLADAEGTWPGVTAAWTEQTTGYFAEYNLEYEEEARLALRRFVFGTVFKATCTCGASETHEKEYDAARWRYSHRQAGSGSHSTRIDRVEGFTFGDSSGWDLRGYDWKFLWSCHAILSGVGQYDALKGAVPAGDAA